MVSGLDVAAMQQLGLRPGVVVPDSGGLVALLTDALRRLDGVPLRTPPAVVMLARCCYGFSAVGLVSQVCYDRFLPRPPECEPVADACIATAQMLADVIGERLHEKHSIGADVIEAMLSDPKLAWVGPDLAGAVRQMLPLTDRMRRICEHIAADETALPDIRHASEPAARTAEFAYMQYFV